MKIKDKTRLKTKTKAKTKDKTKAKTKDKDKTILKTKTKTKDKDEDIDMNKNRPIQVFKYSKKKYKRKTGNWIRRQIFWVFWNSEHISELCEKWIRRGCEYAYTRFEELCTYSGEVIFTREHKATISKRKSDKNFININKLQVFKDFINNQ